MVAVGEVDSPEAVKVWETGERGSGPLRGWTRVYECRGVFVNAGTVRGWLPVGRHPIRWRAPSAEGCTHAPGTWPRPATVGMIVWFLGRNGEELRPVLDGGPVVNLELAAEWNPATTTPREDLARILLRAESFALYGEPFEPAMAVLAGAEMAMTLTDPEWVLEQVCEFARKSPNGRMVDRLRLILAYEYDYSCAWK